MITVAWVHETLPWRGQWRRTELPGFDQNSLFETDCSHRSGETLNTSTIAKNGETIGVGAPVVFVCSSPDWRQRMKPPARDLVARYVLLSIAYSFRRTARRLTCCESFDPAQADAPHHVRSGASARARSSFAASRHGNPGSSLARITSAISRHQLLRDGDHHLPVDRSLSGRRALVDRSGGERDQGARIAS
jgi:hypothetical protein